MPFRKKYCFHSCTCDSESCKLEHYVNDIGLRKTAKKFYNDNFDVLRHSEIIDSKQRSCKKGLFCLDKSCRKKHYCNLTFREEIYDTWRNFERNIQILMEENGENEL
jgi:hypothetical protein